MEATYLIQRNNFYVKTKIDSFVYNAEHFIDKVIIEISKHSGLSVKEIKSKSRVREIVEWRHIACYICRENGYGTFSKIGQVLGGKDHSTILSAVNKVSDLLQTNDKYFYYKFNIVKHLLIKNN